MHSWTTTRPANEVWAQLQLAASDEARLRSFLVSACGVPPKRIAARMHVTVYYARRPMPGLAPSTEPAIVRVPAVDTRFMVLAPGGENPRPELDPARRKVGIRIRRNTDAMNSILTYRQRLLDVETDQVRGARKPSDRRRNAFGARHFQPHMTLLLAGSGIGRELRPIGEAFRASVGDLTFDRFVVDVVRRNERAAC